MSEWQPIETAPKDRAILVLMGGYPTMATWETQSHHKNPRPLWSSERGWLLGKNWDRSNQPTHWMPLPEPPK